MDDAIDDDDPRAQELFSLQAIYTDELVRDEEDPYSFVLQVPVTPEKPVSVALPAGGGNAGGGNGNANGNNEENTAPAVDTRELAYLPALHLLVALPPGYPDTEPPRVTVSSEPMWLSDAAVSRLEQDCVRLWEDVGHDQVVFAYVEHLRQAGADDAFGLVDEHGLLAVSTELKLSLLDYDSKSKQAAFARETFVCGVCLDPRKGAVCHRMRDCGHVFCVQCLQDFYGKAITEGELSAVRCLEPNCAKERQKALEQQQQPGGPPRQNTKPKQLLISPGELLQIPIEEKLVERYVALSYKRALESDKTTVFCPRQQCTGAARSKRYKKPVGLVLPEGEDDEGDGDDDDDNNEKGGDSPQLCICDTCQLAFCSRCLQTWHGEFYDCNPVRQPELTRADLESMRYIEAHSTPCPTCSTPVSKTMGCNHMACSRCMTHFCYLCASWLDPNNPYQHYSTTPGVRQTGCNNRLWDLQYGDDDEFHPDRAGPMEAAAAAAGRGGGPGRGGAPGARARARARGGRGGRPNGNRAVEAPPLNAGPVQVDVAREGPLVLRIAVDHAPAVVAAAVDAVGAGRGGGPAGRGRGGGGLGDQQGREAEQDRGGQLGRGARRGGRGHGRGRWRGRDRGRAAVDMHAGLAFLAEAGIVPDAEVLTENGLLPNGELDAGAEAWIREFVALAMEDNEHLME